MNKLGIHGFVWTGKWDNDSATFAINKSAQLGYDIIEISALDLASIDTDHTSRELEKANIIPTMSLGLDAASDISSSDPEKVKRGEERLLYALSIARDIGATHVCGILYSAFQKYALPPTSDGIARSVEVLRKIGEVANSQNISIGLEVVNRYESNMLNTAKQAVEFCKQIDLPNMKVHLDSYHMNIEEADIAQAILQTGDYLGYIHIGESHRGYLGTGSVDFVSLFRSLADIDYQGPITFESFSSSITGQPLTGILSIWRDLWSDSEDLAEHAKSYIEIQIKSARENKAIRK